MPNVLPLLLLLWLPQLGRLTNSENWAWHFAHLFASSRFFCFVSLLLVVCFHFAMAVGRQKTEDTAEEKRPRDRETKRSGDRPGDRRQLKDSLSILLSLSRCCRCCQNRFKPQFVNYSVVKKGNRNNRTTTKMRIIKKRQKRKGEKQKHKDRHSKSSVAMLAQKLFCCWKFEIFGAFKVLSLIGPHTPQLDCSPAPE